MKKKIGIAFFLVVVLVSAIKMNHRIEDSISGWILQKKEDEIVLDSHFAFHSKEELYIGDQIQVEYSYIKGRREETMEIKKITLLSRNQKKIKIQQILDSMSIEEKIGQLFYVRCPLDSIKELEKYQMGGYLLFDENIQQVTKEQFIKTNQKFQEVSKFGLFIGVDEEGGSVTRLSQYPTFRSSRFQSPQELYQKGGWNLIFEDTKKKSLFLKELGVNMNFAPVGDISMDEKDFIYERTLGKDALSTSQYVRSVVMEMKHHQIASVLKHFPGYGNNIDNHLQTVLDSRPYEQFQKQDFLPFQAGIEENVDCILFSHNIIQSLDEQVPASLSKKIHDILREELHFEGIILTDDLSMKAITDEWGVKEATIMALQAGNDMIISTQYYEQIKAIQEAVEQGIILESRINESLERILRLKYDLQILKE